MKLNLAVIGNGMVGGAMQRNLASRGFDVGVYDPPKGLVDATVVDAADIVFLAVPTPFYLEGDPNGRGFDESYLLRAMEVVNASAREKLVVIKSTVYPGLTEAFQYRFPQHRFAFNPEFLREATADEDMQKPDRQILGVTPQSKDDAGRLFALLPPAAFQSVMTAREAELVKYMGNGMLSLRIAFATIMEAYCQELGADYDAVRKGVGADPRIGPSHLKVPNQGYRGFGGKCLPKDWRALIENLQLLDVPGADALEAIEAYNNEILEAQGIDIAWREGSPVKDKTLLLETLRRLFYVLILCSLTAEYDADCA